MPLYPLKCKSCEARIDVFRTIAERNDLPNCICGGDFERILVAPAVRGEIEPYESPITGEVIDSREKRREEMKRHGYIDYEPGMRKDVERNRVREQEKAMEPINKTVDEIVTAMNVAGKLENHHAA